MVPLLLLDHITSLSRAASYLHRCHGNPASDKCPLSRVETHTCPGLTAEQPDHHLPSQHPPHALAARTWRLGNSSVWTIFLLFFLRILLPSLTTFWKFLPVLKDRGVVPLCHLLCLLESEIHCYGYLRGHIPSRGSSRVGASIPGSVPVQTLDIH